MLTMDDQWEQVAGPLLHPDDTHLAGRSKILHGGHLVRHRQTGVYRLGTGGASLRSVPQDWARQVHADATTGGGRMTGAEYKAAREALGLTQQALADALNRNRVTVADREAKSEIDREAEYALRWLEHTNGEP